MQTRDYDDYVYIPSSLGYRKINDEGTFAFIEKETDGYCNIYANSISVSYLHNMNIHQINAIHYFEEHHSLIFKAIDSHFSTKYLEPKKSVGFRHINIVPEHNENMCFAEYAFLDTDGNKIVIKMIGNEIC